MALKIIGAGFGRTGTESLKTALEILGFGPCHHMTEVIPNAEQRNYWHKIAVDEEHQWDWVYRKYQSAVDWPTAYYWRELAEYFPEAKFILTMRKNSEQWFESFSKTILPMLKKFDDTNSLGVTLIRQRVFGGNLEDKSHMISVYEKHLEDVQENIPSNRLLCYTTGSGWGPLCSFLEMSVPEQPYPSTNQAEGFDKRIFSLVNSRQQSVSELNQVKLTLGNKAPPL
ncbi:MAG: hypothetical protein MI867_04045 [Pseudomonadales bacterium]|nr:hypothetical protein [Pseudomonadales bacterium]